MSTYSEEMQRIAHELMPRVYAAVLNACHQSQRVTIVVGPDLWADIMRLKEEHVGLTAADLVRNDIALPQAMGVPIIDGPDLEPRGIVVRSEVSV